MTDICLLGISRPSSLEDEEINGIRQLCLTHTGLIFDDIVERGLIDPQSKFYLASQRHLFNTCFQSIYPLMEFTNCAEEDTNLLLFSSYLYAAALFLDESLDHSRITSRKVRASLIASYLFMRYFEWLKAHYEQNTVSLFFEYYKAQTDYLIIEKKWNDPQIYLSVYGTSDKIIQKEILLLLPVELFLERVGYIHKPLLMKLLGDYFSYILLTDDIMDIAFDIKHKCLTYPSALYYKLTGNLPKSREDMLIVIPELQLVLNNLKEKIAASQDNLGHKSSIITNKLRLISHKLKHKGIVI